MVLRAQELNWGQAQGGSVPAAVARDRSGEAAPGSRALLAPLSRAGKQEPTEGRDWHHRHHPSCGPRAWLCCSGWQLAAWRGGKSILKPGREPEILCRANCLHLHPRSPGCASVPSSLRGSRQRGWWHLSLFAAAVLSKASLGSGQEEVMGVPAAALWSWLGMEPGARNVSMPLHLPQVSCLPPFFLLPQTCL